MKTRSSVGRQRIRLAVPMLFVAVGSAACGDRSPPSGASKARARASSDPGWARYANADFGFGFRYSPTWLPNEDEHLVVLSHGTLRITVAFQLQGEGAQPFSSGMSAGEFVREGTMPFLGQGIDKIALIYKGMVKVLMYDAEVEDLAFHLRLEDMTVADYEAVEILQSVEKEADRIVSSFQWIPAEQ